MLNQFLGREPGSFLLHFLADNDENDNLFTQDAEHSPYASLNCTTNFANLNQLNDSHQFSFMTFNIQSIQAKFSEFRELICQLIQNNSNPDIICLQEVWRVDDTEVFSLPTYQKLVTATRSGARGGGVGFFIREGIKFSILPQYSIFSERIFESLFVELKISSIKKLIVGTVYRPGTKFPGLTFTEQFGQFSDILTNILSALSNYSENAFILGDMNLDLLKLNSN